MRYLLLQLSVLFLVSKSIQAFTNTNTFQTTSTQTNSRSRSRSRSNANTMLYSSAEYASKNRDKILKRSGPHFELNRFSGRVEFGSTADLVTTLDNASLATISEWLSDEKRVAMSIWDEKLTTDLGDNIYRLELMTLQFITIQLAPQVDNRMWTETETEKDGTGTGTGTGASGIPVFKIQSIDFDPKIQLLPGLNIPASQLGIDIEVVGELRPSANGTGLQGKIGFVTSGNLTPPMRLLPVPALKVAANVMCKTITDFAIVSFQKGVRAKYRDFYLQQSQK